MEIISYKEAAAQLNMSVDALKHGIMRGVLSRTTTGHNSLRVKLIKEQVELFQGKKLTMKQLTPEEKLIWQWYDEQAARVFLPGISPETSQAAIDATIRRRVAEQMAERERQDAERQAAIAQIEDAMRVLTTPHHQAAAPEKREVPEVRPFPSKARKGTPVLSQF